jgi:hypothetical protein
MLSEAKRANPCSTHRALSVFLTTKKSRAYFGLGSSGRVGDAWFRRRALVYSEDEKEGSIILTGYHEKI